MEDFNRPKAIVDLENHLGIKIDGFRLDFNGDVNSLDIFNKGLINIEPIKNLKSLQTLDLRGNRIDDITYLSDLINLEYLYLWNNEIRSITPLRKLKKLTTLFLGNNKVTNIETLKYLTSLTSLSLWGNNIPDLTPLIHLKNISLLKISITTLDDINIIKQFKNLEELSISGEQINDISFLEGFRNLNTLDLAYNQIKDITILKQLTTLNSIDLRENQISDITPLIPLIEKGIKVTNSKNNKFTDNNIDLYKNPIIKPPVEIVQKGNEAILRWFENYENEIQKGQRRLNEAKMIIIGEPDAGKTTLMNYLLGQPHSVPKSTEGFKIKQWHINNNSTDYRINIWDFGGQEIQSTVHQFFLTQDTLYIIVLNARKDEKPDQYLEQIKSYAPNSPILIVINQIDETPSASIDENRLKEIYKSQTGEPLLKAVHKVSILKAHQDNDSSYLTAVKSLEQNIITELMQLPNINREVPVTYFAVKEHLESKFFTETPYITQDTYERICEEKNLGKASNNDLLLQLNNLGTVRYFNDLQLRNLHILNPEWLSDGVYRILVNEKTHQLKGIITEKDFPNILQKTEQQQFNYPPQYYHYLVQMIKTFNLGYYKEDTGEIFIPRAFSKDYPDHFNTEKYKEGAIHFFFKYETFIPSPIISGFIAQVFGKVIDGCYWQKGIVIEQEEMGRIQIALIEQNDIKNRIDIWVTGAHRQSFFIEIRSIFRNFHEKRKGLVVDEMIGLPGKHDTSVKYKVLLAHKMKEKNEYTDEEANDFNIDNLLGMFEKKEITSTAINNQYNIYNQGNIHIGNIQNINHQAKEISEQLQSLISVVSDQNKILIEQLVEGLNNIGKSKSKEEAKGIFAQLKGTIQNFTKISSEEAVKWGTKKVLESQTANDILNTVLHGFTSIEHQFVDYIRPENFG